MKKLHLLIALLFLFINIQAQDKLEIGKLENGIPIITANSDLLCTNLSKNLAEISSIKEEFKSVEIVKYDKEDKDGKLYLLIFRGLKYKATFLVLLQNNRFQVVPKTTCSTSDNACSIDPHSCVPTSGVGDCGCTPCPGNATCTKVCSSKSLLE